MATNTEMDIHGIKTDVTAMGASAEQIDKAGLLALYRDGSNVMTGNLKIERTTPLVGLLNSAKGNYGSVQAGTGRLVLSSAVDEAKTAYRMISLHTNSNAPLKQAFQLSEKTAGGSEVHYDVLHTGNKPSGSYTGNGSATARTINTGGIGSVCVVYVEQGLMLVSYTGAGFFRFDQQITKYYDRTHINFVSGVLTIASDDPYINYNGAEYYYQIL